MVTEGFKSTYVWFFFPFLLNSCTVKLFLTSHWHKYTNTYIHCKCFIYWLLKQMFSRYIFRRLILKNKTDDYLACLCVLNRFAFIGQVYLFIYDRALIHNISAVSKSHHSLFSLSSIRLPPAVHRAGPAGRERAHFTSFHPRGSPWPPSCHVMDFSWPPRHVKTKKKSLYR